MENLRPGEIVETNICDGKEDTTGVNVELKIGVEFDPNISVVDDSNSAEAAGTDESVVIDTDLGVAVDPNSSNTIGSSEVFDSDVDTVVKFTIFDMIDIACDALVSPNVDGVGEADFDVSVGVVDDSDTAKVGTLFEVDNNAVEVKV